MGRCSLGGESGGGMIGIDYLERYSCHTYFFRNKNLMLNLQGEFKFPQEGPQQREEIPVRYLWNAI